MTIWVFTTLQWTEGMRNTLLNWSPMPTFFVGLLHHHGHCLLLCCRELCRGKPTTLILLVRRPEVLAVLFAEHSSASAMYNQRQIPYWHTTNATCPQCNTGYVASMSWKNYVNKCRKNFASSRFIGGQPKLRTSSAAKTEEGSDESAAVEEGNCPQLMIIAKGNDFKLLYY